MATLTYPGVYIQELPSGQHNITGVATSIAVFIGWANQGPVMAPTMVNSWPEYVATFGGFVPSAYLGYAVYQFFLNNGSQAYIVRLVDATATGHTGTVATATNTNLSGLNVSAANAGDWGNAISVSITNVTTTTFNLQVTTTSSTGALVTLESYTNLSIFQSSAQYAVTVVNNDSNYIRLNDTPSGTPPAITIPTAGTGSLTGGHDGTMLTPASGSTLSNFETQLALALPLLDALPIFNLLCVPGETSAASVGLMQTSCVNNRAFLIVDSPQTQNVTATTVTNMKSGDIATDGSSAALTVGPDQNSAFYFPWVQAPDPAVGGRPTYFPPCGFVAGIYATTDSEHRRMEGAGGNQRASDRALGLQFNCSDAQNGDLNPLGINCLRQFPTFGTVVWGARTIAGSDAAGSQWQYIPIRRLALFIESSLYQGTQWTVFEPNAEPLWAAVRLSIGSFMQSLFLKGAFAGSSKQQAYFVKCDRENNPDASVSQGILNITVGFAPLYPAEFVVISIQQMVNQS